MARASGTIFRKLQAWRLYLLLGFLATGGYFLLTSIAAHNILNDLIGASAVVMIIAGTRLHRPVRLLPWYLFALGLLMFVIGDTIWSYYEVVLQVKSPFPSVADVFYLAGYPFIIAGLLLIQQRELGRSRANLIDPMIIATGIGLLSWVFLMGPHAENNAVPLLERLVSIAYPLADVLLLAAMVRLLFLSTKRSPAYYLFGASLVLMLAADTGFAVLELGDAYETGNPIDAGFLLSYVALGAAALHPSMGTLSEPTSRIEPQLTTLRLALLAGASLMAPGVLVIQAVRGEPIDVPVIAGGAVVLILLVLARMADMMRARERAANRERILRDYGSALVSAIDRRDVYQAALDAILNLAKDATKTRASFAVGPLEDMVVVASAGDHTAEAGDTRFDARDLPALLRSGLPEDRPVEAKKPDSEELGNALGLNPEAGSILVSPLILQDELWGALVVVTDSRYPEELRNGLEVLNTQVVLALESIALAEDIHRRQSEKRFRSLIQNASDIITVIDTEGTIFYQSPSVEWILGHNPEDLMGENILESPLVHPEDIAKQSGAIAKAVYNPGTSTTVEVRMRDREGSWHYVESRIRSLLDDQNVGGIVLNTRDVTERKVLLERLEHQAFHDSLTDLANRALFMDRLRHALARKKRHEGVLAVFFLDIDNFKIVNDSLGHEAGDKLLVSAAERILECLRPEDTCARWGGDEFTVLLEDLADTSDATRIASRLTQAMHTPFLLDGREVFITMSIGISLAISGRERPTDLVRNADVALYRAKARGKATHEVFDAAMNARSLERLDFGSELRRAIEREEFVVYYQPQLELLTGKIVGVEALVHWEHPERNLVFPNEFIPVAEETGLIRPLGWWVLKEACRQVQGWHEQYSSDPPLTLCVNLSTKQLQHPRLVEEVSQILEETKIDPRSLVLEVTESAVMEDAESNASVLRRLVGLGVRLAIDDFGTGYSSLAYLKRFPVDMVKIDKSFVDGLGKDPEDTAIVEAIVSLAHALRLKVVAEGIETTEQLSQLLALGCELGQGYHFERPLPGNAITEQLMLNTP